MNKYLVYALLIIVGLWALNTAYNRGLADGVKATKP